MSIAFDDAPQGIVLVLSLVSTCILALKMNKYPVPKEIQLLTEQKKMKNPIRYEGYEEQQYQ
jgi:hypothetical protein